MMLTDKKLSEIVQEWGNETEQRNIIDLCRDVAQAQEAAERERWRAELEPFLVAAADGSMSRNNIENLADELLEWVRRA